MNDNDLAELFVIELKEFNKILSLYKKQDNDLYNIISSNELYKKFNNSNSKDVVLKLQEFDFYLCDLNIFLKKKLHVMVENEEYFAVLKIVISNISRKQSILSTFSIKNKIVEEIEKIVYEPHFLEFKNILIKNIEVETDKILEINQTKFLGITGWCDYLNEYLFKYNLILEYEYNFNKEHITNGSDTAGEKLVKLFGKFVDKNVVEKFYLAEKNRLILLYLPQELIYKYLSNNSYFQ